MDRCPNCRARQDDPNAANCRRCGMELALLRRAESAAHRQLATAIEILGTRVSTTAPSAGTTNDSIHRRVAHALRRSLRLRRDPLAEQLLKALPLLADHPPRPADHSELDPDGLDWLG
jgi:hypothetical protein